jgi:hypothetical protein
MRIACNNFNYSDILIIKEGRYEKNSFDNNFIAVSC